MILGVKQQSYESFILADCTGLRESMLEFLKSADAHIPMISNNNSHREWLR